MKAKIQKLIPIAREAILEVAIPDQNQRIRGMYHGYVSALGAGFVQAGLLPAVIFFENSQAEEEQGKIRICQAIRLLIDRENNPGFQIPNPDRYRLSHFILENDLKDSGPFLRKVTEYATAIKIALRTFEKIDDD